MVNTNTTGSSVGALSGRAGDVVNEGPVIFECTAGSELGLLDILTWYYESHDIPDPKVHAREYLRMSNLIPFESDCPWVVRTIASDKLYLVTEASSPKEAIEEAMDRIVDHTDGLMSGDEIIGMSVAATLRSLQDNASDEESVMVENTTWRDSNGEVVGVDRRPEGHEMAHMSVFQQRNAMAALVDDLHAAIIRGES